MWMKHRIGDENSCSEWGNKSSSFSGGPSPFWTQCDAYGLSPNTGQPPSQEFPAAAYGPLDFHCERALNSWNDPVDLNAGWLTGLTDLNTGRTHVQERIAAYLTDLISLGFSGFRIDAAKHVHPDHLVSIFQKLRRNLGGKLPSDFVAWLEVLLGGESDMLMCEESSGYNYGLYFLKKLKEAGLNDAETNMIKIWNSGFPKEPEKGLVGCDPMGDKIRSVVQNDDADQQNSGSTSRDMGNLGCVLVTGCSQEEHRAFEVKLFDAPSGASNNDDDFPIRLILSSFYWLNGGVPGIPDGKSECSRCREACDGCVSVPFVRAFNATSTGYDGVGYTRVHRDASIVAAMRRWMKLREWQQ